MDDVLKLHQLGNVKKIHKGWSGDQKYYAENIAGGKFLLRISDVSEYRKKQKEFAAMQNDIVKIS